MVIARSRPKRITRLHQRRWRTKDVTELINDFEWGPLEHPSALAERGPRAVFPMELESVAAARSFVAVALQHCGGEAVALAQLLTSELATNAILHARSRFDVAASEAGGVIHITVTDGSTLRLQPAATQLSEMHGRGLYLLRELSERWGVIHTQRGKTVWFDLACEGDGHLSKDRCGNPD